MTNENPKPDDVNRFLARVIEAEEHFAFAKKGQDSARKEKLRNILDEFCEEGDEP